MTGGAIILLLYGGFARAAPGDARASQVETLYVALRADDSEGELNMLSGLVTEFGGVLKAEHLGHDVRAIRSASFILPNERGDDLARDMKKFRPAVVLERWVPPDSKTHAVRRKWLKRAAAELGDWHRQFPVLAAYLQMCIFDSRNPSTDGLILVVVVVVEDPADRERLLAIAKANRVREYRDRTYDPDYFPPGHYGERVSEDDLIGPDAVRDAKTLRDIIRSIDPRPPAIYQAKLDALESEVKDNPEYLAARPTLSSVLAEARKSLRARMPEKAKRP